MSLIPHPFDERIIARLAAACDDIDAEMERGQLGADWRLRKDFAYSALAVAIDRAAANALATPKPDMAVDAGEGK